MGSHIPFFDLNLLPDPDPETTSTPTTEKMLIPKIEPKLEPLDEPALTHEALQSPDPRPAFFPDSTPTATSISLHSPTADQRQNLTSTEASDVLSYSDQDTMYAEFYRISELFHTAFAKRLSKLGDVEVLDPDSRAIVPVPPENQIPTVVVASRWKELVRITNLRVEDERYFRDVVRRTRMIYNCLRILSEFEDEKGRGDPVPLKRMRGHLRASAMMRERGLWLNRDKRIVGTIPGVYIGDLFFFRMEMCVLGLHGQPQAGIDYLPAKHSFSGESIATSIIVSGGYEDDEDGGDVIIYTGHGGQDKHSRQCCHQKLEGGNLALERSMYHGIEVRVIRGIKYHGSVTSKVYVYDGLYRILECWFDVGKSGFGVYKYKLVRIKGQPQMGSESLRIAANLRARPLEIRPSGYFSLDMTNRKEYVPVRLFNDIDSNQDPLYYEYLSRTAFPPFVSLQSGNGSGCSCVSVCGSDCFCSTKNGGEFPYDQNGLLLRGKPVIFECSPFCSCPPHCRNRVTQKGLKSLLEVFRSKETGWGVRPLELIRAGAFICEYTGVVLTREQAQIFSMNGDALIYPNRFSDNWAEWGDLSRVSPDYVRPSYPSVPPLDFAMDVTKMRNVACYISHSSTPNVFVQLVLYDHNNLMFPHLMLFAMENIPPLRVLSLDYGVADEVMGKLAICS